MSKIIEILEEYKNIVLYDEDGFELKLLFNSGALLESLIEFEMNENIKLPNDLRELLLFSNGLDLFGHKILSIEEMQCFASKSIVTFHEWGNGDFDCVSTKNDNNKETIFFMYHSVENLTPIHSSLIGWIKDVIDEIQKNGTLLHPYDYDERQEEGIYKKVIIT